LGDAGPTEISHKKKKMHFEIIGRIEHIEIIAVGGNIRDIMRIRKQYGYGRWRKLKGIAAVKLENGHLRSAEVHWYEAHGVGKRKMKIKRFVD
jgi:hypothetical protein